MRPCTELSVKYRWGDTFGKIVNEKSDKKSSKAVPWKKMLNNDTDMQLLLFNIITGGGTVGGIISFIASLIIKTPLIQDVAILTALAVLGICIYLANAKKMVRQSVICTQNPGHIFMN